MNNGVKIRTSNLFFAYNGRTVLRDTSITFASNRITAIVGPSGSGKSTFLLTMNRLWESIGGCTLRGTIEINFGERFEDIYGKNYPVTHLRRRVGMVFQTPNPLPMSIFNNVAFPLRLAGRGGGSRLRARVEQCLQQVQLWDEVHDRLDASALELSGGQQQRLCLARALILEPQVLLLDEPTSSLDQRAAATIEKLLVELKQSCTILLVSHYHDQVQRIADAIVEMSNGRLLETETR